MKKIYLYQFMSLIFTSCIGSLLLMGSLQTIGNVDTWLAAAIAFVPGIIINFIALKLHTMNDGLTLEQINQTAFGKFFGKTVTITYSAFFLFIAAMIMAYYSRFAITAVIKGAELWVFVLVSIATVFYVVHKGFIVVARLTGVFSILLLLLCVVTIVLEFQVSDTANLIPEWDYNKIGWTAAAFAVLQFGGQMSIISFLPNLKGYKSVVSKTLITVIVSNIIVGGFLLLDTLVLGNTMKNQASPFFRIMRMLYFNKYLDRVEIYVVTAFFFATLIRVCCDVICAAESIRNSFNIKKKLYINILFCLIIAAGAILLPMQDYMSNFIVYVFPLIAVVWQVVIPIISMIVIKIKKTRLAKSSGKRYNL